MHRLPIAISALLAVIGIATTAAHSAATEPPLRIGIIGLDTSHVLHTGTVAVHGGSIGNVLGCDIFSPCALEKTHPDLSWYGIHGVESLFTLMGTGCQSVARSATEGSDVAVGIWKGGRIGVYRGMRCGAQQYGGMAFGEQGNQAVGAYDGYQSTSGCPW